MPKVEILIAALEQKAVLANLMQLYTHDFSEHWSGTATGELGEDGLFDAYPYLDSYWSDPTREPLLIRVDGRIAGFALVNAHSHSGRPLDRNVAEFFIVRKHRRDGVGTQAARAVFARHPGIWEAAIARRNVGALAFWRGAIGGCPSAQDVEETDVATEEWDGQILRFRMP